MTYVIYRPRLHATVAMERMYALTRNIEVDLHFVTLQDGAIIKGNKASEFAGCISAVFSVISNCQSGGTSALLNYAIHGATHCNDSSIPLPVHPT